MSIVPSVDGRHLPRTLLGYAVALAVFLLVPPAIKATIGPPEAFTGQELLDLFTPVVVLPMAWLVLTATGTVSRSTAAVFVRSSKLRTSDSIAATLPSASSASIRFSTAATFASAL